MFPDGSLLVALKQAGNTAVLNLRVHPSSKSLACCAVVWEKISELFSVISWRKILTIEVFDFPCQRRKLEYLKKKCVCVYKHLVLRGQVGWITSPTIVSLWRNWTCIIKHGCKSLCHIFLSHCFQTIIHAQKALVHTCLFPQNHGFFCCCCCWFCSV